jgi:hypothetical protein
VECDLDAYIKTLEKKGIGKERAVMMLKTFTGKKAKELFKNEQKL